MPMDASIALGDGDVLGLSAVRCAGERELVVAPADGVEAADSRGAA